MNKLKIRQSYDRENDVLYISFTNPPQEGIVSTFVSDYHLIRINPYTERMVGITILDFQAHYDDEFIKELTDAFNDKTERILNQKGDEHMAKDKDKGKPKPITKPQPKE